MNLVEARQNESRSAGRDARQVAAIWQSPLCGAIVWTRPRQSRERSMANDAGDRSQPYVRTQFSTGRAAENPRTA